MCEHCAGHGFVPDPFGDRTMQAAPCPLCSWPADRPYLYTALVGGECVAGADTLAELVAVIRDVFEAGLGEDVAVWERGRELVAAWLSDGRVVWFDRARVVA